MYKVCSVGICTVYTNTILKQLLQQNKFRLDLYGLPIRLSVHLWEF